jgi:hypothetical protein
MLSQAGIGLLAVVVVLLAAVRVLWADDLGVQVPECAGIVVAANVRLMPLRARAVNVGAGQAAAALHMQHQRASFVMRGYEGARWRAR